MIEHLVAPADDTSKLDVTDAQLLRDSRDQIQRRGVPEQHGSGPPPELLKQRADDSLVELEGWLVLGAEQEVLQGLHQSPIQSHARLHNRVTEPIARPFPPQHLDGADIGLFEFGRVHDALDARGSATGFL